MFLLLNSSDLYSVDYYTTYSVLKIANIGIIFVELFIRLLHYKRNDKLTNFREYQVFNIVVPVFET